MVMASGQTENLDWGVREVQVPSRSASHGQGDLSGPLSSRSLRMTIRAPPPGWLSGCVS